MYKVYREYIPIIEHIITILSHKLYKHPKVYMCVCARACLANICVCVCVCVRERYQKDCELYKKKEELHFTHMWFAPNLTYPPVVSFLTLYPYVLHSVTIPLPTSYSAVTLTSFLSKTQPTKDQTRLSQKNTLPCLQCSPNNDLEATMRLS